MTRTKQGIYLPHNNIELIRGGRDYFGRMHQMINEAKYTVHLQVYIFDDDETGRQLTETLINAARRNVRVYVLVDGYASQRLTKSFIETLTSAGIYFRMFEPLLKSKRFYFGRRLHHKVLVTDSYYAMVGGINISNRYNDLPEKNAWLDWAVYLEGSAVPLLDRICARRMHYRKVKGLEPPSPPEFMSAKMHGEVRVRENDWVRRKRQIYNSYLEMFRKASSHIIIMSPYFLPGNEFRRSMRRAVRRGVKIKLVLAGISDVFLTKHAERFIYRWLLRNNIEIYEYRNNVLHGKVAVCDGEWLTIGSYNVNDLSAYASIELNVDVKSADFVRHVEKQMNDIISKDCVCITSEVFEKKHTTLFDKMRQRFAYDFFRLVLFLFTFYFRQRE